MIIKSAEIRIKNSFRRYIIIVRIVLWYYCPYPWGWGRGFLCVVFEFRIWRASPKALDAEDARLYALLIPHIELKYIIRVLCIKCIYFHLSFHLFLGEIKLSLFVFWKFCANIMKNQYISYICTYIYIPLVTLQYFALMFTFTLELRVTLMLLKIMLILSQIHFKFNT